MADYSAERSQRTYARVAGFMYLFALAGGIFGFFVRSKLSASGNAAETANNIIANEQLVRIGIAVELSAYAGIIVLALALYVLLKPVNKNLALLALLWWVGEAAILAVIVFLSFAILILLSGAEYLNVFQPDQLQAVVTLFLNVFHSGYNIGLIFFGLGSTVFSYLLFRSKYVPRILAAWGVFASLAITLGVFVMTLFPSSVSLLGLATGAPIFVYELLVGLWLLLFGANIQSTE